MTVQTLAIIVLLVSFFVMIFLRFPIAYAVGLSSVLCMLVQGQALTDVCRLMVKGISSFSLMAVPFFITMGVLMGSGGISEKLIALADACVGWMRGGMAMVNIVASYFFGGISGSASADTASIGSIMIPMMVDQGYDADFSTAVTITSSCEGLLVPPSHNMVIYATTAGGISVGSLFLAGYLPGIWLGRSGTTPLGQQLAAYYTSRPEGTSLAAAFGAQLAVSFLQLILVLLCGFCVWGVGLLALLFAARGLFLGYCAASVAAQSGASALLRYRLDTLLSDVGTLLLCLWLAGWSVRLAMELFRAVRGRAARETPGTARRLAVRFAAALALSAAFAAVGAVLAVVGIGGVGH